MSSGGRWRRRAVYAVALAGSVGGTAAHGVFLTRAIPWLVSLVYPDAPPDQVRLVVISLFLLLGAFLVSVYLFLFLVWLAAVRSRPTDVIQDGGDPPSLSVVIPAYNEELSVGLAVKGALRQDYPQDRLEVIVVDDGSTDSTAEVARAAGARVLVNPENRGKAEALTLGIASARGEVIITTDADTVLSRWAARAAVDALRAEDVGAASGDVRVAPSIRPSFLQRMQEIEYAASYWLGKTVQDYMGWVLITPGAMGIYKGSLLREMGLIPPDTVAEDFDVSLSTWRRGYRVVYAPQAVAWTKPVRSARELRSQRVRWFVGGLQVLSKYPEMILSLRRGAVGVALFAYLILVEYLLPSLGVLGYVAVPLALLISRLTGVGLLLGSVPLKVISLAFLAFLPLQHVPGIIVTSTVLASKGRADLIPWTVPYHVAYSLWLSYLKLESLLRFLSREVVGWRP